MNPPYLMYTHGNDEVSWLPWHLMLPSCHAATCGGISSVNFSTTCRSRINRSGDRVNLMPKQSKEGSDNASTNHAIIN